MRMRVFSSMIGVELTTLDGQKVVLSRPHIRDMHLMMHSDWISAQWQLDRVILVVRDCADHVKLEVTHSVCMDSVPMNGWASHHQGFFFKPECTNAIFDFIIRSGIDADHDPEYAKVQQLAKKIEAGDKKPNLKIVK